MGDDTKINVTDMDEKFSRLEQKIEELPAMLRLDLVDALHDVLTRHFKSSNFERQRSPPREQNLSREHHGQSKHSLHRKLSSKLGREVSPDSSTEKSPQALAVQPPSVPDPDLAWEEKDESVGFSSSASKRVSICPTSAIEDPEDNLTKGRCRGSTLSRISQVSMVSLSNQPGISRFKGIEATEAVASKRSPMRSRTSVVSMASEVSKVDAGETSSVAPERLSRRRNLHLFFKILVNSSGFDYVSGVMVAINAVVIGMQTDYLAHHVTDLVPIGYRFLNAMFCAIFGAELALRALFSVNGFFRGPNLKWNVLDCCLVILQIMDEILGAFAGNPTLNFSFIRILRGLRLLRILRIMRIIRLLGELRHIASSIFNSLSSLCWTILLIFMLVYMFGIYFTQVVLDHRLELRQQGKDLEEGHLLLHSFQSLAQSILTLYQAITQGLSWGVLSDSLIKDISLWLGFVISFFMAFALLALLNVITGVFVDAALKGAKDDRDRFMIDLSCQLFEARDELDWDTFQDELDNKALVSFFQAIDVDPSEAEFIFKLIDVNDNGGVDLEEFINGCLNLKGPAKAIDSCKILQFSQNIMEKVDTIAMSVDKLSGQVTTILRQTRVTGNTGISTQSTQKKRLSTVF
eukprot:TRINITY_DN30337_c0_g1_i1.p1 TRINITY_DN30337_c0_g1~~TRINITY_DN30337_c0_g1_i1.p1  ORF type:complete len:641 (-),score=94.56 TRINITY_DN30337_c0_g1_i1:60-1958(-)